MTIIQDSCSEMTPPGSRIACQKYAVRNPQYGIVRNTFADSFIANTNSGIASVPEPDFELDSTVEDVLPAFGSLTTDEERERKAQSAPKKGTYVVVANPMSFWSLPEYRDNDSMSVSTRFPGRHDPFDTPFTNQSVSGFTEDDDPDVVILKKFEDTTRKGSAASSGFVPSMESPTLSFHSHSQPFHGRQQSMLELPPAHLQIEEELQAPHEATASLLDRARNGGSDWPLLQHYRTVISPSVIKFGHQVIPEDIFEIEARTYRPVCNMWIYFIASDTTVAVPCYDGYLSAEFGS